MRNRIICAHEGNGDESRNTGLILASRDRRGKGTCPESPHLSGTRGAKQLVVVKTHTIELAPCSTMARVIPARSVHTWSPSTTLGTTSGTRPAVDIALKHDFWSIRGHITYFASGPRRFLSVCNARTSDMPVAIGRTRHAAAACLVAPVESREG